MAANRQAKQKLVLEALKNGNTRTVAARAAGIHEATIRNWIATDARFSLAIMRAEAEGVVEATEAIKKAGEQDWRALAWWIEHSPRTKNDWKRVQDINWRDLSVEQLLALAGDDEAAGAPGVDSAGDRLATAGAEGE